MGLNVKRFWLGAKRLSVAVCTILAALTAITLTGCGSRTAGNGDGKYSIVCTTYPQYDWVKQIIGDSDNYNVTLLLKNGVDMHSFQPTAEDMYKVASADMFVYVGGTSDQWVDGALKNAKNKNMQVVNMVDILGDKAKVEELVEGMQEEHHEHSHDDHDHDELIEYDEHVWLSVDNAMIITKALAESLKSIDSSNADKFEANSSAYIAKLSALDKEYRDTIAASGNRTVLFGDRFPFRYLADEYGLSYYAAFPGCSAETEASFETVTFLSGKVDELGLKSIFVIENSDRKVAETIKKNTKTKDQTILTLNSMQSVTNKDIEAGATYLKIMEDNLAVLKKGL